MATLLMQNYVYTQLIVHFIKRKIILYNCPFSLGTAVNAVLLALAESFTIQKFMTLSSNISQKL